MNKLKVDPMIIGKRIYFTVSYSFSGALQSGNSIITNFFINGSNYQIRNYSSTSMTNVMFPSCDIMSNINNDASFSCSLYAGNTNPSNMMTVTMTKILVEVYDIGAFYDFCASSPIQILTIAQSINSNTGYNILDKLKVDPRAIGKRAYLTVSYTILETLQSGNSLQIIFHMNGTNYSTPYSSLQSITDVSIPSFMITNTNDVVIYLNVISDSTNPINPLTINITKLLVQVYDICGNYDFCLNDKIVVSTIAQSVNLTTGYDILNTLKVDPNIIGKSVYLTVSYSISGTLQSGNVVYINLSMNGSNYSTPSSSLLTVTNLSTSSFVLTNTSNALFRLGVSSGNTNSINPLSITITKLLLTIT